MVLDGLMTLLFVIGGCTRDPIGMHLDANKIHTRKVDVSSIGGTWQHKAPHAILHHTLNSEGGVQSEKVALSEMKERSRLTSKHVQITTGLVQQGVQLIDVKGAFEEYWTSIPVNANQEFRIAGDCIDMCNLLMTKKWLQVSCSSDYVDKPIHLVVLESSPQWKDHFLSQFGGGACGMGGLASLIGNAPALFDAASPALQAIMGLLTNPSSIQLDSAADYIFGNIGNGNMERNFVKEQWHRLNQQHNDAFLTVADPRRKGYAGESMQFVCRKYGNNYKVMWSDSTDEDPKPLTAAHLAILISMMS